MAGQGPTPVAPGPWRGHPLEARPVPESLTLPPIDRLPSAGPEPNVLRVFVTRRARPWGGVPVPLSRAVTAGLWVLLVLVLALSGWLVAVRAGCSGTVCAVATLGDHPRLALALSAVSAGTLAGTAP